MSEEQTTIDNLLSSYPLPRGSYDASVSDADMLVDFKEWAETMRKWAEAARNILETVTDALDVAGAPHATISAAGLVETKKELTVAGRVLWLVDQRNELAKERDWLKQSRDADHKDHVERIAAIDKALRDAGAPMNELTSDQGATWLGRELAEVTRQRNTFMEQRDEAMQAVEVARETVVAGHKELVDRRAEIEALDVEIAMLEAHIDCVEDALPEDVDGWADWDLEP